jgi:hypothetical protein
MCASSLTDSRNADVGGGENLTIYESINDKKKGIRWLEKNQMEKRDVQIKNSKLTIIVFYLTNNLFRSLVSFSVIFV